MRASSMSTSSKLPSRRRCSARIFSMSPPSASFVDGEAEAEQVAELALPPPDLGRVEDVLAQDLRAELARREGKDREADEREQQVLHVGGAEEARGHALPEERPDARHHAADRALRLQLPGRVAREVVVLEQRAEQQARVGRVVGEQVHELVEPALQARERVAAPGERANEALLDAPEDACRDRGVELRLVLEVVEERGFAESDHLGQLGEADARVAALGEQGLGGVEDLVARALLGDCGDGLHRWTRPIGRVQYSDRSGAMSSRAGKLGRSGTAPWPCSMAASPPGWPPAAPSAARRCRAAKAPPPTRLRPPPRCPPSTPIRCCGAWAGCACSMRVPASVSAARSSRWTSRPATSRAPRCASSRTTCRPTDASSPPSSFA